MGEVCRVRDTALNRDVALKMLPEPLAADSERLARFTREAQTLAALNHPNIAQIYGVADGSAGPGRPPARALVMEYVEGQDLSGRLERGALPLDETLAIAKQIADALEAAHDLGIVHRDLKPANIRVRPDGTAKVLDFGLARSVEPAVSGAAPPSGAALATITSPAVMTGVGIALGTAAYMAPEQARGRPVDKRADVWAFGCVLYEMLTGRRLFDGQTVAEALASVMKDRLPLDAVPADTPPAVRRLLTRCLERDPRVRLRDIGEARIVLERELAGTAEPPEAAGTQRRSRRSTVLPWLFVDAALAGIAAVLGTVAFSPRRVAATIPLRVSAELGADVALVTTFGASAVLSPDGRVLSIVGRVGDSSNVQLYVRRLDTLAAVALAGTAGARDPFFSPDGAWLGFFADGKLKKVPVSGGPVVTLADAPNSRGGTWAEDGTIIFQPVNAAFAGGGQLMRVSSSGGSPQALNTIHGEEVTQRWPQALPGGGAVLFTRHVSTAQG